MSALPESASHQGQPRPAACPHLLSLRFWRCNPLPWQTVVRVPTRGVQCTPVSKQRKPRRRGDQRG
jgi:hypothetical protein